MTDLNYSFSSSSWRLLLSPPAQGSWNMAVDEAILEGVIQGSSLPTLRLFAWQPACLSLGYAQSANEVDLQALQAEGWGIVRRPTGGRAILHIDEITYSVIAPISDPRMAGGVLESYQRISRALLLALQYLDVPAVSQKEYSASPTAGVKGPVCFEVPSNYEITVEGKKLIGSAQARRKEGVLQHGSLPLYGDITRITRALVYPDETTRRQAAERVSTRALTVETAIGRAIPWETAAEAFISAFTTALNLSLVQADLSETELASARTLEAEKYAHPDWTYRV